MRFPPATHKMFHHSAIAIVFLGFGTTGIWLFGEFGVQCGEFNGWDKYKFWENLCSGAMLVYNIFVPEGFQVFQNKRRRTNVYNMNTVLFLFVLTFCYFILMYPIFLSISIPGFIWFKKRIA